MAGKAKKKNNNSDSQRVLFQALGLGAIALVAIIVIIVILVNNSGKVDNSETDPVVTYAQKETTQPQTTQVKQEFNFNNPGGLTISKKDCKAAVDYSNPATSNGMLKYRITCGDKTLYESEFIAPGQSITQITLDAADLAVGEYKVMIFIDSYTMDGTATGNGTIHTKDLVVTE